MEIVLEPEIRGAEEVGAAVKSLQLLLRRLGTCDGNMEDGSMRCDLNVSIRPAGGEEMGERVEVSCELPTIHFIPARSCSQRAVGGGRWGVGGRFGVHDESVPSVRCCRTDLSG